MNAVASISHRTIHQREAYASALAAVLLWSTVASAFKLTLRHLSVVEMLMFSTLISTVVLGVIVLATGRFNDVRSSTAGQWGRSLVMGLVNPFVYYLVLFKAYDLLPAQQAQPINYTWALTLAVLSVPLLGQRIGAGDFLGLLLGYFGVVVVATQGYLFELRFTSPTGVGLALGSTLIWSLYWIQSTRDARPPVACLFQNFLCALAPTTALYVIVSGLSPPNTKGLLGAAYVGAVEMSLGFVLWLVALRLSENTAKVGSLIFLSPFLSLVFIHFFVGETIHPSTMVGLAFILGGLLTQKKFDRWRQMIRHARTADGVTEIVDADDDVNRRDAETRSWRKGGKERQ
ncbi:MAG: DMT family transporter [Pirellulaceae bacterium]|nr:DMT family transporter [Pirellulaceae bacterium]